MIARYTYKLQSECWYVFIAYDGINFSRHFSCNWATKKPLHLTQPAIYREFIKGPFSIKRSRGNFNKIATSPSHRADDQHRSKGIRRDNWNKYIGWSTSKVDAIKSYHCWAYGQLQRKCQSCIEKNFS